MQLADLLVKGYFPEELLPPFTTEDLSSVLTKVLPDLDELDPISGNKKRVITKSIAYSIPKIKGYRRNLGIPHPLHYIRLASTIVDKWGDILTHCNQSSITLSPITIKATSARSILKPSFKNTVREKIIRSTGYRYLLKVDIAKFYSSIYTHSIPWALHTKDVAKQHRKRKTHFGNALDEDSRKLQDGQTVGLPIGPDTSRIISEIILVAIDKEMKSRLGYLQGVRVVDDYHLYFKTHGDLEKGRAVIHKALKDYELELNQNKELLLELPEVIENEWFSEIREFKFRNRWNYQRTDIITFFDVVITYAKKFPDELVLTYAMSKLRFTVFNVKNWKILQSLMLNALLIEPKILPYVAQNLIGYYKKGFNINETAIKDALEQFIIYHSDLSNDFEISWALWILKSLKIEISEEIGKVLSKNENPVVIMTILDVHDQGYLPKGLDTTAWQKLLTVDNLYNEYWLLAYEAKMNGWLSSPDNYLEDDEFFKILKDKNVSFYKPGRVQDLSKIKISLAPDYFEDEAEPEDDDHDADSVYSSVEPKGGAATHPEAPKPAPAAAVPDSTDDDDLPF